MIREDLIEVDMVLVKLKKACRYIGLVMKTVFVIFCVYWLVVIAGMAYALLYPGAMDIESGSNAFLVVLYIAHGCVIAAMLAIFIVIVTDTEKGKPPFTLLQVRRLRLIALLLIVYAVLDFAVTSNMASVSIAQVSSGYALTNDNVIVPINLAPIFAAGVVFAFSFVFKYGVLLQEFSDETL